MYCYVWIATFARLVSFYYFRQHIKKNNCLFCFCFEIYRTIFVVANSVQSTFIVTADVLLLFFVFVIENFSLTIINAQCFAHYTISTYTYVISSLQFCFFFFYFSWYSCNEHKFCDVPHAESSYCEGAVSLSLLFYISN